MGARFDGHRDLSLLDEKSPVVANASMNRERGLSGINSYSKELGVDVFEYLQSRITSCGNHVEWLDCCCGTGKALVEAAILLEQTGQAKHCHITGIDLAGMFFLNWQSHSCLRLVQASLSD